MARTDAPPPTGSTDVRALERDAEGAGAALPALLADAGVLANTVAVGSHGRRKAGTGETFWQYREYTIEDAASAIDWRQSARRPDRLFVRETEWESAATIGLYKLPTPSLDYRSAEYFPTKGWRTNVLLVATAMLLARAGEGFLPLGVDGPVRRGATGVVALAEMLLSQPAEELIDALPTDGRAHQSLIMGDFHQPTDALIEQLSTVASAGRPLHLVQVSDPAEELFPFSGHTVFRGQNATRRYRFGDAGRVADEYQRVRTAHFDALKAAGQRLGISYLSHRSDHSPAAVMTAIYFALNQGGDAWR